MYDWLCGNKIDFEYIHSLKLVASKMIYI